jgi:hypothetical protein
MKRRKSGVERRVLLQGAALGLVTLPLAARADDPAPGGRIVVRDGWILSEHDR